MSKMLEMWIDKNSAEKIKTDDHGSFNKIKTHQFNQKVTITFHEERKVTITEDEFDSLFNDVEVKAITVYYLKEKLFNKQD